MKAIGKFCEKKEVERRTMEVIKFKLYHIHKDLNIVKWFNKSLLNNIKYNIYCKVNSDYEKEREDFRIKSVAV